MKTSILYKNCLIWGESFQREKNGTWVPQFMFTRENTAGKGKRFPREQYQYEVAFTTEKEADEFAVGKAKECIDDD